MRKILIVDGGPRRAMNTAALCDAFAEGARAASPEIAVERIRLYDLPAYRGCVSCLACKLKGRENGLQPEAHLAWRAAHWEEDLEKARSAGRAMAGKV